MENLVVEFKNENDIDTLVKLSKTFENENICNGIVADDYDFFKKTDVAVARLNGEIVGYIHGRFEYKTENNKYFYVGQKTYYIEEIYVKKEYRSIGIGRELFKFIESYAKMEECEYIEVTAVSRDYKRLLDFYCELGMEYWYSELHKKLI